MPRLFPCFFALFVIVTFTLRSATAVELVAPAMAAVPALPADVGEAGLASLDGQLIVFGQSETLAWSRNAADWRRLEGELPGRVLAATSHAGTLLVAVGSDGAGQESALYRVDLSGGRFVAERLVELPETLRGVVLAAWDEAVYLGGSDAQGVSKLFWRSLSAPDAAWVADHPSGIEGGELAGLAFQDNAWFAFSNEGPAELRVLRKSDTDGWQERTGIAGRMVLSSARAIGQAHILVLSEPAADGTAQLWTYHVITDAWTTLRRMAAAGIDAVQPWGDGLAFLADEDGATSVVAAEIVMEERLLRPLDWIVIVLYLSAMAGIGLYCLVRDKRHTTADFFVGGRNIPFWAAGLSLYATGTSAISYIAIPAKSFSTNWLYLAGNIVGLVAVVFVAIWIVPLIRRLNLMSVYHYLEMRFHPSIRMMASAINIVLQLGGRMSVVLFLPSLVISAVTGIDVIWSIVIMGVITIGYTVMGGMKAVIWTDVIQVFVMLGGAFFTIGYVIFKLEGGFGEFIETSMADDKMRTFDWSWDLTKATVWGFVFLAVLDVLTYPKDQVMMQRVLSTKSAKAAGWSVWTLAIVVVPGSLTFYAIGTALYAFYKQHPEKMNPLLTIDATFPHFIAAELPVGVTGLIIAGIFAASMSTLSSCINSVATLVSVDFYEKISKNPDPKVSVRIAEVLTIVAGLIGVGTAIALTFFDIRSFFDLSLELAGLLGGGFAGTYALGIFTKRANWQGAAIGVTVSIGVTMVAWSMQMLHSFFYSALAIFTCIVVGYASSLFFPPPMQSLAGLTIGKSRRAVEE